MAILRSFRPDQPVLGIADLADQLGMTRSTAHRYATTLLALGFLEQSASRKYRLGPRSADIGRSFLNTTGLRTKSRSALEQLRRATSHTVAIGILDEREVICVNRARSFRARESLLWLHLPTGARLPAHRTAIGKLLLAGLPKSQLDAVAEVIASDLPKRSNETRPQPQGDHPGQATGFTEAAPKIRSRRALLQAVHEARDRGYAISDQEWLNGISEIAVPLRRENDEIGAAIAVFAGTAIRSVEDLVRDICPLAQAAASDIAAQLDPGDPIF